MSTPPSDKENSSTLANAELAAAKVPEEVCPDEEKTQPKSRSEEDEFDDADALEALAEAESKQDPSTSA